MNSDYFILAAAIFTTFFSVYKVRQIVEDENKRIGRVYQRIDETKDFFKEEYVSDKICDIKYKNMHETYLNLERKVDVGFKSLDEKIVLLLQKTNSGHS